MNNKNKYLLVFLFIVCILSISAISSTENTSKEVTNTNNKEYNTLEVHHQSDDVSHSNKNVKFNKTTPENKKQISLPELNKKNKTEDNPNYIH